MKRNVVNDELLIEEGARLAGSKAPVKMDLDKAGKFVRTTLHKEKRQRPSFFRKGGLVWGTATFAIAACAVLIFILGNGNGGTRASLQQIEQEHCSTDSVTTGRDSVLTENFEICSINE